jgi:hypothetical protein
MDIVFSVLGVLGLYMVFSSAFFFIALETHKIPTIIVGALWIIVCIYLLVSSLIGIIVGLILALIISQIKRLMKPKPDFVVGPILKEAMPPELEHSLNKHLSEVEKKHSGKDSNSNDNSLNANQGSHPQQSHSSSNRSDQQPPQYPEH